MEDTPLGSVIKAARAKAKADAKAEKAREILWQAIRESSKAGEPVSMIAHAAGISRQHVHQILKEG
jgi:DNA invertase Pin-like site-specific DNA recombinase